MEAAARGGGSGGAASSSCGGCSVVLAVPQQQGRVHACRHAHTCSALASACVLGTATAVHLWLALRRQRGAQQVKRVGCDRGSCARQRAARERHRRAALACQRDMGTGSERPRARQLLPEHRRLLACMAARRPAGCHVAAYRPSRAAPPSLCTAAAPQTAPLCTVWSAAGRAPCRSTSPAVGFGSSISSRLCKGAAGAGAVLLLLPAALAAAAAATLLLPAGTHPDALLGCNGAEGVEEAGVVGRPLARAALQAADGLQLHLQPDFDHVQRRDHKARHSSCESSSRRIKCDAPRPAALCGFVPRSFIGRRQHPCRTSRCVPLCGLPVASCGSGKRRPLPGPRGKAAAVLQRGGDAAAAAVRRGTAAAAAAARGSARW